MTPHSIPRDPAQPDLISYPPAALAIVTSYTYDSFVAAFGEAPPPPDRTRELKTWFDTSPAAQGDGQIVYRIIKPGGVIGLLRMSKAEARTVNLPSKKKYPAYSVSPTNAVYVFNGGDVLSAVDPLDLSTLDQANKLAEEVGNGAVVVDATPEQGKNRFQANGETRRMYALMFPDNSFQMVGRLLREKNRDGLGAPMQFVMASPSDPDWLPIEVNTEVAAGDPVPLPIRALLPNEVINVTAGGEVQIVRTDKQVSPATPAPAGGLKADEREALFAIRDAVVK